MSVRVRFSQERPGVAYVPSSHGGPAISPLLASMLSSPMPSIHPETRYRMDSCTAASIGDEAVLRELISEKPGAVTTRNSSGWTPLLYAAYLGHQSGVTFLLDHGAQIEDTNIRGQTSLMLASACGNTNVVRILLERRADPHKADRDRRQALHYAASCNQNSVVDILLSVGADPNAQDATGMTPTHEAAMTGHELSFHSLLEKGGSVDIKNNRGDNAESLACDHDKILAIIAQHRIETTGRVPRTLSELLDEMGLSKYCSQFRKENIDLKVFFDLSKKDFDEMNIPYGPKTRMLDVIANYRTHGIIDTMASDEFALQQYGSRARENEGGDRKTTSLRSIRDINDRTKTLAVEALKVLPSGHGGEELRRLLVGIIDGIDAIAVQVTEHDL